MNQESFKDWFTDKLLACSQEDAIHITSKKTKPACVLINVSDEIIPTIISGHSGNVVSYFWFPMNEVKRDIGLNSIYGAMNVMHEAERKGMRVIVHCKAGANRSQIIKCAYYSMRAGQQLEDELCHKGVNQLIRACNRGYLPPKKEMEKFLRETGNKLIKKGEYLTSLDKIKLKTINNF